MPPLFEVGPDTRPAYRVAVFGLAARFQRAAEIVLRHARHNPYRFELATTQRVADFDIALVDMTGRDGSQQAKVLRAESRGKPILTVGRRNDPARGRDDLLQQRFTLTLLPSLNGIVDAHRLVARMPEPLGGQYPSQGLTVPPIGEVKRRPQALIVDDSPTVRHHLSLALLRLGVDARAAGNADEALRLLDEHSFDLAVFDVVMSGMDGFRLTRKIKRHPRWRLMPVIILTSRSSPFDLARGALAGCSSYLVKPVSPQSLRDTIERNLTRSAMARERALIDRTPGTY